MGGKQLSPQAPEQAGAVSSSTTTALKVLPAILTAVVAVLAVGGLVYWLQEMKLRSVRREIVDITIQKQNLEVDLAAASQSAENREGVIDEEILDAGYGYSLFEDGSGAHVLAYAVNFGNQALDQISSNGETIENFFFPRRPENNKVVYIATRKQEGNTYPYTMTSKIYSYAVSSGDLNLLYQHQESGDSFFEINGAEGSKLVVSKISIDWSPGPCTPQWGGIGYSYLDLTNPKAGLRPYAVPEDMLQEALRESEQCVADLIKTQENTP